MLKIYQLFVSEEKVVKLKWNSDVKNLKVLGQG